MRRGWNEISTPANVVLHVLLAVFAVACFIPLVNVLSVSLSDQKSILQFGYRLVPKSWSGQAYRFMWDDLAQIGRSYGVSTIVTAAGTLASIVLTALYAYPLSRRDFPYRKHFAIFLFITMLFNGGLVPFYVLYTQYLHIRDSLVALILPYLVNPFYVIIMRTYITSSVPDSLIEAAKLDGASEPYILVRIVFPVALPVFATIALFVSIVYWNDWFMSLLFISNPRNVSIQFYMYKTILNIQYMLINSNLAARVDITKIPTETVRMAMAIVGIGPIVFAYPFFQRYFVKGLTLGAVKG